MSKKVMIFGTNTGIGKTVFSALLCKELKGKGYGVKYIKPIQTGYPKDNDALFVKEFAHLDENSAFAIIKESKPVAAAAIFENLPIEKIDRTIRAVDNYDFLIIETAGGVCSPIDKKLLNYHLSTILKVDFNIVVVPHRLGCISDALLVNYLLENEGLDYMFALNNFFNASEDQKNTDLINHFTGGKIGFVFKEKIKINYPFPLI